VGNDMPIKRIFNKNNHHEDLEIIKQKIELLEKQLKKLNTVEVQMKRLIHLEKQLGPLTVLKEQLNKEKNYPIPDRTYKNEQPSFVEWEKQILAKIEQRIVSKLKPYNRLLTNVEERLSHLETNLSDLEKRMQAYSSQLNELREETEHMKQQQNMKEKSISQPVIFQEINIDKMLLDKYELNNNIAQLGINELSGSLNIGTTYEKGIIPPELAEEWKEKMEELKQTHDSSHQEEDAAKMNSENKPPYEETLSEKRSNDQNGGDFDA
jgi:L-cysteine desulfidase